MSTIEPMVVTLDQADTLHLDRNESNVHDRTNGRIYKICYGDPLRRHEFAPLADRSDLELAELVLAPNDWYVRHGRRLLQERAAERPIAADAIGRLTEIALTHADDTRRLRAAWALHVTGPLDSALRENLLIDLSPYVRGWAVQLSMESTGNLPVPRMLAQFEDMAREDESPVVRLYLAAAAQRLPPAQRWQLLVELTRHAEDASDHNLPLMYWYAAEPLAEVDTNRALALALSAGEAIPPLREFMLRRIGSSDTVSSLNALIEGLGAASDAKLQLTFLQAIRTALRGQRQVAPPAGWTEADAKLRRSDDSRVRLQAMALGVTFGDAAALSAMRAQVASQDVDADARRVALQALLAANDPGLVPTLLTLLTADAPLRETALGGLAQYDDADVAPALLAAYPTFTPAHKRQALATLCARVTSGVALLKAIEAKQIAGTDLTADLVRQLQFLKNAELDGLLTSVWGTARESATDKLQMIAEFKQLVASTSHPAVDVELGRAVFADTCMKCHILFGKGNRIGPDLTGSNRANLDYLLSNVVDPSAVMAKEYRPTIIATQDGRVVTGLVTAEDNRSVTLMTPDAEVIVPKNEIDERVVSPKSMMPDDQLKQFNDHQIRSLVAYLQSAQQTPMLATSSNSANIFNGRDLTGWSGREGLWSVEQGELVGRTEGLKRNEWIVSDLSAADFRLTVEVKLVDNAGNSGIQFRSKAHDGEVSGYQADIGQGWWGKLYEEHGRALLWDQSGEAHVKLGDWNTYEVVAEGDLIRTFINGEPCVDFRDPPGARRGIIAFQLHSGGPTEVRFRNIRLEVLDD